MDLGGSRFKVLQVKVREGMGFRRGGVEMEEKTYDIPKELLIGRGTEVRRRVKSSETREVQEVWTGGCNNREGMIIFNRLLLPLCL